MCIMEVRPGQHDSTIQQACAHNIGTVASDLVFFEQVLRARKAPNELKAKVSRFLEDIQVTYENACALYGDFVALELEQGHIHQHDYPLGNERPSKDPSLTARDIALADIHRARKYETR